jgi:hypothetical protein
VNLGSVEMTRQVTAASEWKQRQFNWGLLQGLWRQAD